MTASYQKALIAGGQGSPSGHAREYLAGRGIDQGVIDSYRIGMVDETHDLHAKYAGMICIPYLTKLAGVVSLKFRKAYEPSEGAKYISEYESRLYNTLAMDKADRRGFIAAVEGEINALTLDALCDIPAVGIPGAKTWKAHPEWRELFRGYGTVLLFPDEDKEDKNGEKAGDVLADMMRRDLDTAKIIRLPDGADANRAFLDIGAAEIRRLAGIS
jgi:DNA primase